jgi:S-adenosylmethionine decarboxylase
MQRKPTHIYNFRCWIDLTDAEKLRDIFRLFLEKAGYGIVNFTEHHFQPQGYTCIWLLSESHLALHTFPEEERTYVELSGCSKEMNRVFVEDVKASAVFRLIHDPNDSVS